MKVYLNELDELRLKLNRKRNNFPMSRNWFDVALASKDNELKKAKDKN